MAGSPVITFLQPPAAMTTPEYILTLSCLDQRGIVYRVSGFLAEHGCNIIDSAQFEHRILQNGDKTVVFK